MVVWRNKLLILFYISCIFSFFSSRFVLLSKDLILGKEPQFLPIEAKICFQKEKCVFLEVANTPKQRIKGLMFRKSLKENHGMLFIFDKPVNIDIWMKNTLFPLDVIFIRNNKIVNVQENLKPCYTKNCEKINSVFKIDKIIELMGGSVKKFNIQVEKVVEIENL